MDKVEFSNSVIALQDPLFRIAKRLLVSTEEAQDACQEVMTKLWLKRAELEKVRSVEAYAITMCKNYCLDRLKSKQASNLRLVHSNYQSQTTSLDKQVEYREEISIVDELVKTLPKNQQLIFHLREVEGLEYNKIEEIVGMNPTALRVALSRIRKQLRDHLIKMNSYGIKEN